MKIIYYVEKLRYYIYIYIYINLYIKSRTSKDVKYLETFPA